MTLDLKKLLWPWIFFPLTAVDWWLAWSKLPEQVVMKFGPNGQPASWATREQALTFDLEFLGSILVFLTLLVVVVAFAQPERVRRVLPITWVCSTLAFIALNAVLWMYQVG